MPYVHTYPLHLHRDDGQDGLTVATPEEAHTAFGQGFKLWTPDGLVNPLAPVETPAPAIPPVKPGKKKG